MIVTEDVVTVSYSMLVLFSKECQHTLILLSKLMTFYHHTGKCDIPNNYIYFSGPGMWSEWVGDCDMSCGPGIRFKTRQCLNDTTNPPLPGCEPSCPGQTQDAENCNLGCCPSE